MKGTKHKRASYRLALQTLEKSLCEPLGCLTYVITVIKFLKHFIFFKKKKSQLLKVTESSRPKGNPKRWISHCLADWFRLECGFLENKE